MEEQQPTETGQERQEPEETRKAAASWRDVGEQLQELGSKLAAAFRAAWSEEQSAEQEEAVRSLQRDLRETAERLERVVRRVAHETEPERGAAYAATREASEQSLAEMRVATASGLRTLNQQIDSLVKRLKQDAEKRRAVEQESEAAPEAPPEEPREQ